MHSIAVSEAVDRSSRQEDTSWSKRLFQSMDRRFPPNHFPPHESRQMLLSSSKRPTTENNRDFMVDTSKFSPVSSPCDRGQFSSVDPSNLTMQRRPQVSCLSSAEATGTAHHLPVRAPLTFRSTPQPHDLSRRSLRWGDGNHQGQHRYRRNSRQGLGRC